jgi:hypothetical protein
MQVLYAKVGHYWYILTGLTDKTAYFKAGKCQKKPRKTLPVSMRDDNDTVTQTTTEQLGRSLCANTVYLRRSILIETETADIRT